MKKINIPRFLNICAGLLCLGFCLRLGADYYQYNEFNSAPFYVSILVRAIEFLIPALVCALIGRMIKNRVKK